jgi:hypothetical protein
MFNILDPSWKMFNILDPSWKMFNILDPSWKMFNILDPSWKMFNILDPGRCLTSLTCWWLHLNGKELEEFREQRVGTHTYKRLK